jgi:hypothetical protein
MFPAVEALNPSFQLKEHMTPDQYQCYLTRRESALKRFTWTEELMPVFNVYLIHASANVPGKIAYYASVANLMAGRLTRTSPEMFLERTLKQAPHELRMQWSKHVLGQVLPEVHFVENDNPDGWYDVYDEGPGSCMQGAPFVRQYAHPKNNLRLAYMMQGNDWIVARTIVNEKRKTYLRIYANSNVERINDFTAALKALGYTHSQDTLKGETVRVEWAPCEHCGEPVLRGPYLDGNWSCVSVVNNKAKEGVIGSEGVGFNYADGEEEYISCTDGCGFDDDEDEDY